jgi:hypothetical protein
MFFLKADPYFDRLIGGEYDGFMDIDHVCELADLEVVGPVSQGRPSLP